MPQELILKIHDSEPAREARAPLGPCSIGRGEENDVMIDAPGVSRRHAVIGHYSDGAQISDCNSQNGTFVNGRRIVGSAPLNIGDVISLGGVCEITVVTRAGDAQPAATAGVMKAPLVSGKPPNKALMTPIVAVASIAVIVVIAVVVIFDSNGRDTEPGFKTPTPTPAAFVSPSPPDPSIRPDGAVALDRIESAARQLMRRISRDSQVYDFPDESPLRDINGAVGQCCQSASLAAALQTISRNRDEFIRLAGNQITPDLLAYAVLAETNGGANGAGANPRRLMDTARSMAPKLISLRNTFGDETSDSVLIFVAAYPEGVFPRGGHPLLSRIPGDNPMRERKVWSLARRGKFKPGQYEFVLRFIAYGIIAGNPKHCGIESPMVSKPANAR
ncbi:MAG TPA: FHA domain-containing protein [Blastocatellia bacterium]|nr:FHA domain-containing protein [Blastocatellia bacterium]